MFLLKNYDLVIIGHLAKDIIEIDGRKSESLGGGVYYGGLAARQMGLEIAIITRLSRQDSPILHIFQEHEIQFFFKATKETSGIWNIYSSEKMENRTYRPLGFAGPFEIQDIPDIETKIFVIAPILAGEIDLNLLKTLNERYKGKIGLDIQGFIRIRSEDNIHYQDLTLREKEMILSKVTFLKLDQTEAEILTHQDDIDVASQRLLEYGPREIMITHQKGITLATSNGIYQAPWKNATYSGRTGRGDTAFISYLGSRLQNNVNDALKFSAALTSLKMESPGPFNLPLEKVFKLLKEEYRAGS
jgi:hypothetical protein